jgi:pimeloyl-ACP methyl ester carboxylesterase
MVVIWGENDRFAPVQLGHELEKRLPGVPFQYLKDTGHTCQQDQPERIVQIATDFFELTLSKAR